MALARPILLITVVTSTKDDKEARVLLKHLGFPFKEN